MAGASPPPVLTQQGRDALWEGVRLYLCRWEALQLALEHNDGNPAYVQQLHGDILKWLTTTKGTLYVDELENLLDDRLLQLFGTEADDGSIEEVAEKIMDLHEDCLVGDFSTVERLAQAPPPPRRSVAVPSDTEQESDEEDDDEMEDAASEDAEQKVDPAPSKIAVGSKSAGQLTAEELEAGWQTVPVSGRRRTKGDR